MRACMRLRGPQRHTLLLVHINAIFRNTLQLTLCVVLAYHNLSCGDKMARLAAVRIQQARLSAEAAGPRILSLAWLVTSK